jgi:hypothetical protein
LTVGSISPLLSGMIVVLAAQGRPGDLRRYVRDHEDDHRPRSDRPACAPKPTDPEHPDSNTMLDIVSELRRAPATSGGTVGLTVLTTDVADALTIAWAAFRSAARDDLTG